MSAPIRAALGIAGQGTVVVGEVAQAHDGSLGTAHAYIDAIAAAGADAVKFQTHIADAESSVDEPWRVPFSRQDERRIDYWRRMEFTPTQWQGLRDHAGQAGLAFLSSPFSPEAVELLATIGADGLKLASGEVTNLELLEACTATGLPLLLSSGMSTLTELDRAVDRVRRSDVAFAVFQCSSTYPCPPEAVGLNLIPGLAERFDCEVGLSDHSGTIFPALAAVTLGASVIEVHVTLSREAFGPDVTSSVTTAELGQLVTGTRFVRTMLDHPVDKDHEATERGDLRAMFTRSLRTRSPLTAGHRLTADDLQARKPGGGMPPDAIESVVGRRLTRDLAADVVLEDGDLEAASSGERPT